MIKPQTIKDGNQPIAVIIDYQEYQRLKELEQDMIDYSSAYETKMKNKTWTSHQDLKKELGF